VIISSEVGKCMKHCTSLNLRAWNMREILFAI
jgi:hypothetical protein